MELSGRVQGKPRTILLVDDDYTVVEAVRAILYPHGWSVLVALSGQAALGICQEHSGPIDLLITDLHMPGMDGLALAERVIAIRPEIRVLLMSGDAGHTLGPQISTPALFIQKPFNPDELIDRVQAARAPYRGGSK